MGKIYVLAGALCFLGLHSVTSAQPFEKTDAVIQKHGLFAQLPDTISVSSSSLLALLSLDAGSNVIMEMSRNGVLPLEGVVTNHSDKFNGRIRSVSIRSTEFNGAVLHLTKVEQENGDISFRGTWMHQEFSDIFFLTRHGQDYLFTKKRYKELIME